MMFLLFISLFSLSNGAMLSVFQNPKEFVESLVDANPATIQKMIDMVDELLQTGENERAVVIDEQVQATNVFNEKNADQIAAAEAKNVAGGNAQSALNERDRLAKIEATAKAKKDDALISLNAADAKHVAKHNTRVSEVARLDGEKALMEQILNKLDTLLPGTELIEGKLTVVDFIVSRRLLATAQEMADRDAVEKIVNKINALVGEGEGERRKAIQEDEDAEAAFVKATNYHDNAVAEHKTAAGQLGSAEATYNRLAAVFKTQCQLKENADAELADATADLDKKTNTMNSEVARIDSEKSTLEQVNVLLDGLLAPEE
jgi:hypothetical protein